jgi:hypothetical protein
MKAWITPSICALVGIVLWATEAEHQKRVSADIPERWRGSYDSPTAWQREVDRRVQVSVAGQFIKVQETNYGEVFPAKFLKVKCSVDYADYVLVKMPDENTAVLRRHPSVPGFYEFEFTDIAFIGETPNGQELYENHGVEPVPLERK